MKSYISSLHLLEEIAKQRVLGRAESSQDQFQQDKATENQPASPLADALPLNLSAASQPLPENPQ